MSLRALVEIVVHLESFRNIDLFYQGLYYIKANLYYKKNDEVPTSHFLFTILIPFSFRLCMHSPTACSHLMLN